MTRITIRQRYALLGAALLLSTASSLRAQTLTNLFGGNPSANVARAAVTVGASTTTNTNTLGAGYTGTVTLGSATALASITESVNTPTLPDQYSLTTSGVAANDSFSADTNVGNVSLLANSLYRLTLTKGSNTTLTLSDTLSFRLGLNGTAFVNTATGLGIAGGSVNVLGLFGAGNTASFVFTTPAVIPDNATLNFGLTGALGVNASTRAALTLTGASIMPVPEPGPVAAGCVGLAALAAWRRRHPAAG